MTISRAEKDGSPARLVGGRRTHWRMPSREQDADVLAAGKVASSPSSPCSGRASAPLRVTPGGSGRSLALRCARRPRVGAGDGQTGASGGGSELRVRRSGGDGRRYWSTEIQRGSGW